MGPPEALPLHPLRGLTFTLATWVKSSSSRSAAFRLSGLQALLCGSFPWETQSFQQESAALSLEEPSSKRRGAGSAFLLFQAARSVFHLGLSSDCSVPSQTFPAGAALQAPNEEGSGLYNSIPTLSPHHLTFPLCSSRKWKPCWSETLGLQGQPHELGIMRGSHSPWVPLNSL